MVGVSKYDSLIGAILLIDKLAGVASVTDQLNLTENLYNRQMVGEGI